MYNEAIACQLVEDCSGVCGEICCADPIADMALAAHGNVRLFMCRMLIMTRKASQWHECQQQENEDALFHFIVGERPALGRRQPYRGAGGSD